MDTVGIPTSFYEHDALSLAPMLLGKHIVMGEVSLRIRETEAYMPDDSACHAYKGKTSRNAPMFAQGGILYVYLCYGIHQMLNVVTGPQGEPQAVLIRAADVVAGADVVQKRRGNLDLIGPGKVGQALALDKTFSGERLGVRLSICDAPEVSYTAHPRVGIGYAKKKDRDALWRFVMTPMSHAEPAKKS